jgi:hypothetical protein
MRNSADQVEAGLLLVLIAVGALIVSSVVVVALFRASMDETPSRVDHGATDAPYLAAQTAKELARGTRPRTRKQGVDVHVTPSGFTIKATSREEPGVWYRLTVDHYARRVTATCGGNPTEFCVDGR